MLAREARDQMSRRGLLLSWAICGALLVVPLASAGAQNLDAGKSGGQIFSQVCSNCHRSPRALRSGASTSFLREHYTTSPGMAAAVAAYLSAAGRDPSASDSAPQSKRPPAVMNPGTGEYPAQPKRPPAPINPGVADAREKPVADAPRDTRREESAEPKPLSGLLRGSEFGRTEVAKPANSVEAQTPPSAPPRSPVLEDFEQ